MLFERPKLHAGNDQCPVTVKLIAAPRYVVTTQGVDKEARDVGFKQSHCGLRGSNRASQGEFSSEGGTESGE